MEISREAKKIMLRRIVLLALLTIMIILTNTNLVSFTNSFNFVYLIKPLLWLGFAFLVFFFPRVRAAGRLSLHKFIVSLAFGAVVIYIMFMMVGGMLTGFGKSPYSFSPLMIILNLLNIVSFTLGVETARAYLLNSYKGERVILIIGVTSILFCLTELSFFELIKITDRFMLVKYLGGTFCPALAGSILLSYLAYLGGFIPATIYHGLLLAFEWFSPVLPNLSWPMKTFLGCFIPIFSLLFIQHLYLLQSRMIKKVAIGSEQIFSWLLTSIVSVLIIWFAVGMFPVYPSVIVTGSMEPEIKPGDIVLLKKITGEEAKIGDVIQYYHQEEKIYITHRVIAINREKETTLETKGDNNSSPDFTPVTLAQVKGKVMKIIPKVGWITLIFRSKGEIPASVIN